MWKYCYFIHLILQVDVTVSSQILKFCSPKDKICPVYSICSKIAEDFSFQCLCLENFKINPQWNESYRNSNISTSNNSFEYCLANGKTDNEAITSVLKFAFFPTPTTTEDLIFSSILIVLAVFMILMIYFGLKAFQPIKRTQAAYRSLQNKRKNIVALQELDELETQRRHDLELQEINRV